MTKSEDIHETTSGQNQQPTNPGTAPEVPTALAKQMGINHRIKDPKPTVPDDQVASKMQEPSIDDDPQTDAAVDSIVTEESDQLLADTDATQAPTTPPKKRSFLSRWWHNKPARYITLIILLTGITAIAVIPKARYVVLNKAGVRASSSVIIVDDITKLPLKNVSVAFGDKQAKTDTNGVARVTGLPLGPRDVHVQRLAFASYNTHVVIGWGSNPLGTYTLHAVGTRYEFYVVDSLSGKPISGASAESEQASALSDKDGKVSLTLQDATTTQLKVTVTNAGYLSQEVTLNATQKDTPHVALLPDNKVVYVSKQSGTYDVYSSSLDGHDRKVLLKGTGLEDGNSSLVMSPDNTQAALVSTRDDQHDASGTQLVALTIINIETGSHSTVDHAQQIQLIDWVGNRLLYRTTVATTNNDSTGRNRIVAYDYAQNARLQLATAGQFNVVLSARGYVYYAAAASDPAATLGLFAIKPDGTGKEQLSQQEVWTGLRTGYDTVALQTQSGWSTLNLNTKQLTGSAAPATFKSYAFATSPKGTDSTWIDIRNGTTTLLLHRQDGSDTVLATQPGIATPLYWLGDSLVAYRVSNKTETAEYVVSASGGTPKKIADVAPTYGFTDTY
jgi:hypothetical protein